MDLVFYDGRLSSIQLKLLFQYGENKFVLKFFSEVSQGRTDYHSFYLFVFFNKVTRIMMLVTYEEFENFPYDIWNSPVDEFQDKHLLKYKFNVDSDQQTLENY